MKRIFLTALIYFACFSIHAQTILSEKENTLKKFKELLEQNRSELGSQKNNDELLVLNTVKNPVFLYETDKGKVYSHPLDGMRFLVPQFSSKMPIAKSFQKIYIPNPILPGNMPGVNLADPLNNNTKK